MIIFYNIYSVKYFTMESNIFCFAIIEYFSNPKVLGFYSSNNHLNINEIKNIFSNPNFNIKSGVLSSFSYDSKSFFCSQIQILLCF